MAKQLSILLFMAVATAASAQKIIPATIKMIPAGTVKYQGNTNTCWSYSTTSMIESGEIDYSLVTLGTAKDCKGCIPPANSR